MTYYDIDIEAEVPKRTTAEQRKALKDRMVAACREILDEEGLLDESEVDGLFTVYTGDEINAEL
jgi:hypothetical protein